MNAVIDWTVSDQYLFNGRPCTSDSLTALALNYLMTDRPDGSPQVQRQVHGINSVINVSGGKFDFILWNEEPEIERLKSAVIAVSKAIVQYKDHLALELFNETYVQLDPENMQLVDQLVADRLQFFDNRCVGRTSFVPLPAGSDL